MTKIAIIGAGSLSFSKRLMCDILTYDEFKNAHFALCDTDTERLEYATRITERIFKEGNYPDATFSASTNRREILEKCDFVIISILVGGYEAIEKEVDIPMKYGVSQAIGDTLTPGGIMRCLRTLPTLVEMGKDIAELCPRAHVLNYTNPMGMLSRGFLTAVPNVSYVGLCHSVQAAHGEWAERLNVPEEELVFVCAGINHTAWIIRLEHKGENLLPHAAKRAVDPAIWNGDTARMEYVKHFGYPVTESSGHNSEYVPWFRKNAQKIEDYCPGGGWNGEHGWIKHLYSRPDWRDDMEKMANGETPFTYERSNEYGSRIIHSITTGKSRVIYGNVMNNGLISNLPADACVEVPCHVDINGIQPIQIGALPPALAAINRTQINVQELAVLAALTSEPEYVFQAMALDPLTAAHCTLDEIRAMTGELLEAHKPWLPAFEGKKLAAKPVLIGSHSDDVEKHIDPTEEPL